MRIRKLQLALLLWTCTTVAAAQENPTHTVRFLFAFPEGPVAELPLSQPQGFAVDSRGDVFVADTGNNRLLKFDAHGEFVDTIGGFGWNREEFDRPLAISVKSLLDVFVADYNNERIDRYDKDLNFISSFQSTEDLDPELQFDFPVGVDISKHGELFICDSENDRVLKLNSFGEAILSFGGFNWGDGRLESPARIEITDSDVVFVSDGASDDIVVFDYYGTFVTRFGGKYLNNPVGLAWAKGFLFVADSGNDRIVAFDRDYRLAVAWGRKGSMQGAFEHPVDVATFRDRTYVLDSGNNRIQIFQLMDGKTH